jgi:hypothetical protein
MAYKKKYAVLALLGISVASGAAWWWQNKAPADGAAPTAAAPLRQAVLLHPVLRPLVRQGLDLPAEQAGRLSWRSPRSRA